MNKINICYTIYLSYVGFLVLIKAVTITIPAYAMSITRIPTTCLNQLENISRKFLWNGKKDGKTKGKINWKKVCQPKNLGGLGIRNLQILNNAYY